MNSALIKLFFDSLGRNADNGGESYNGWEYE
jgi:hypothetical protein